MFDAVCKGCFDDMLDADLAQLDKDLKINGKE